MTVSVIIPAFNAEAFLERAVTSALAATPLEVIIVDDASTDGTRAVAEALAKTDARVRVAALPVNGGPSKARNAGFAMAKGDWLAVLDADDAFAPDRLGRLTKAGAAFNADIVADNLVLYDAVAGAEAGLAIPGAREPREIDVYDYLQNAQSGRDQLDWGVLKPLFRRDFLLAEGISYPEHLRHGEDFNLVTRALLAGARFVFLPEGGYIYTERWGSLSKANSGQSRTSIDYAGIVADADLLLRHPRVQGDPRLRELMQRRRDAIQALDARHRTRSAISRRDVAELARLVVSAPGSLGALATVVVEKATAALSPRAGR